MAARSKDLGRLTRAALRVLRNPAWASPRTKDRRIIFGILTLTYAEGPNNSLALSDTTVIHFCGNTVIRFCGKKIRTTVISPGAVATELPKSVTEPDLAQDVRELYELVAIPADLLCQHGHIRHEPAG